MNEKEIAVKLKQIREEQNMTQKQFADLIGVSYQYIGFLETGRETPSFKFLTKLIDVFGKDFPIEWLMGLAKEKRLNIKNYNYILDNVDIELIKFIRLYQLCKSKKISYFKEYTKSGIYWAAGCGLFKEEDLLDTLL